jgi:hypothetical protein
MSHVKNRYILNQVSENEFRRRVGGGGWFAALKISKSEPSRGPKLWYQNSVLMSDSKSNTFKTKKQLWNHVTVLTD